MENKVLYSGLFEDYPLSVEMVDGILTFKFTNIYEEDDEYQYILEKPEDVKEGEEVDDDYQILRREMAKKLSWYTDPQEDDIIQAIGELLYEWDTGIYTEEDVYLEDAIQAIWKECANKVVQVFK